MIKNEEYIDYLKKVIACVSNGDYYSVKELSSLKLEMLKQETFIMEKNLRNYKLKNNIKKEIKEIEKIDILYMVNLYVEYIFNQIKEKKELKKIATIEEFFEELK